VSDDKLVKDGDDALEALSPAEEDVVMGAWLREKRPGRRYVRAGVSEDGKAIEYVDTDEAAVKRVAATAARAGTVHSPRALPKPTRKHLADTFDRALERGDMGTLKFLMDAERLSKGKRLKR